MGMDMAVSKATSLHHRKPHSHRVTLTEPHSPAHAAVETYNCYIPIHNHEATGPHKLSKNMSLVCLESQPCVQITH